MEEGKPERKEGKQQVDFSLHQVHKQRTKMCYRIPVALLQVTLFIPLSPQIPFDCPPLQTAEELFHPFTDSAMCLPMSLRLNFGTAWITTRIPHVLKLVCCL